MTERTRRLCAAVRGHFHEWRVLFRSVRICHLALIWRRVCKMCIISLARVCMCVCLCVCVRVFVWCVCVRERRLPAGPRWPALPLPTSSNQSHKPKSLLQAQHRQSAHFADGNKKKSHAINPNQLSRAATKSIEVIKASCALSLGPVSAAYLLQYC